MIFKDVSAEVMLSIERFEIVPGVRLSAVLQCQICPTFFWALIFELNKLK
jgi:hypothetical protein